MRSKLVGMKNAIGLQMTDEEEGTLKKLSEIQKEVRRARDSVVNEKTDTKEKLEDKIKARRKSKDGWFVRMDKIFAKNGCNREDYHKRQFSGKPLKEIKKQAETIFSDARVMLLEFKDPDVNISEINTLCDNMVDLLTRSYNLFEILHKHNPTQDDIEVVRTRVTSYIAKWREMLPTMPPKAHIIEDHAVEQFVRHLQNGLWLVIEQFVERNHQEGRILDDQCKRVPILQQRAETHCKRKGLNGLASIRKRQKVVQSATAKGKYKKKGDQDVSSLDPPPATVSPMRQEDTGRVGTGTIRRGQQSLPGDAEC